ncbi:type II toxin-antitoxin system VapC family toxin [Larkinella soli]|uniref:type II toxin-antitoxin system VapC family toxin n=1 Tax=Larkinella soli TaxID=1770527 RepID=UPI000FFC8EEE|nr:PIN domain-containing protein [Larkinella soli]
MIYFDTDVLVHYRINQDDTKHQQAIELYRQATHNGLFLISVHSLNELAFVFAKMRFSHREIVQKVSDLYPAQPVSLTFQHTQRAIKLADKVGFHHIGDCLHTAVAEAYCDELYTYNRSDFSRIQKFTSLKITIL